MLKKFAVWFIVFGLSFLVSDVFGSVEQGKAFFYINIGARAISDLAFIVILILAGIVGQFSAEANRISFILVLIMIGTFAISLFATWAVTKLFDVDFYVAYQIIQFGQCLCGTINPKKKDD